MSSPLTPGDVPFSWRPGCPVPPGQLRAIHLSYVGFDGRAHTAEIIVNASVVHQVIEVFSILYWARFPINRTEPVDVFHGSDPRSMAADNTSGFNCRYAGAVGPSQWSMHAYGLAIDVSTVQNPYLEPGSGVQPPAGAAYVDRSDIRPGWPTEGRPGFGVQLCRLGMGRELGGFPRLPAFLAQRPVAVAEVHNGHAPRAAMPGAGHGTPTLRADRP